MSGGVTGTGNILMFTNSSGAVTLNNVNNVGTITNTGAGSPSNGSVLSGIGANVTSVIQDSLANILFLQGSSATYNNGILVRKGGLQLNNSGNVAGAATNIITLGDSFGSANTSVRSVSGQAIVNPIQIAAGNTGTASIELLNSGFTVSSLVTLNSHDLNLNTNGFAGSTLILSGGVMSTGTGGSLTLNSTSTSGFTLSGATGVNNAGTITNLGTGSGLSLISANIGSNVTNILQNSGASNLSFSGTNAYTGTTTVNAGTLTGTQTSGNPFSTGNVVLNGGTLQLTPTAAASLSGANALAGSTFTYAGGATLGLTKNAANNLAYTVGNASPGGSVLVRRNTGTLVLAPTASANLGSSEKFVVNGLTSAANINGIYSVSVVDQVGTGNTGVGSFVKYDTTNGFLDASTGTSSYTTRAADATLAANEISDVTTTLTAADTSNPYALRVGAVTLTNAGTTTVNGMIASGTNSGLGGIILNPTATASVISGGTLAFGSSEGVVYVGSGAGGGSITSVISGTAGLTKFGPGVLTLNNAANTYTGTTTINSGTLAAGANDQIATGALTINGSTSVFSLGAFTDTVGTVTVANFGSITGTGTLTSTGSFELQNGSVSTILAGANIPLNKTTTGIVTLSGANTYTGATTVSAGTLLLNGASGSTTGATAYSLNGGSLFLDNSGTSNVNRINNASTIALNGGSFSLRGPSNAALSETVGTLSGTGNSTITVSYNGSSTNVVTLNTPTFTHNAGNGTDLVNGANLGQNSTGTANMGRIIIAAAPTLVGTTAALTSGINSAVQNTRIVPFLVGESNANGLGTAFGSANTFVTYIAGSGLRPLSTSNEFTNNAIASGNNTYITAATTSATNSSINSLVINGADLSINDTTTLTNSSGALLFASNNIIKPTGTTGIYTGSLENQITVNSGVIGTISAIINGNQPLTKSGAGTLVLTGSNTYDGATTVTAGTLVVDGSLANTGTTVASGATLSGIGTIGGATAINGTHSPGAQLSGNGQTFSSTLAYGGGSIFEWDLTAPTNDLGVIANSGFYGQVVANGALSGSSMFMVVLGLNEFTDEFWNTDKTWTNIFTGSSAPTNLATLFPSFGGSGVSIDGLVAGRGQFSFNGSTTLTWSAVPEPASVVLAGFLLGAGLLRRRRI